MHLSFIGMSGVGKSYRAKQLAQAGWLHLDCDAMIAERLGTLVQAEPSEDAVHAVGRWMGLPWSDDFTEREARYLVLESDATQGAIAKLHEHPGRSAVIDTTGSVIYTGDVLLAKLKQATRVVYFDVPDTVRKQMVELYLREPKPVLWRGMFNRRRGESDTDALARCYAELLADRAERYRALADITLDYHALRKPGITVKDLLTMIV